MDRRIQKTRNSIYDALGVLLEKKSYSRITVKDIIDEANIGRSTFYSHFETKDSLLNALCDDIFEHVFSDDLVSEKTHDFSKSNYGLKVKIIHMMYHLKDSERNIKGLLSSESGEVFLGTLKMHVKFMAEQFLSDKNREDAPKEFIINHLADSIVGMVKWWVAGDMSHTPEEMAEYFFYVSSGIV